MMTHTQHSVSDGRREAGETAGLDPKDDSAVGNAETPNPPPSGDIGELVEDAEDYFDGWAEAHGAETSRSQWKKRALAAEARIAELEKEWDEALAANRGLVRLNEAVEARAEAAESRLSEAVKDAERYRWLRSRDVDTIHAGGVFAGKTPENLVINGEDLDRHIDEALAFISTTGGDNG